MDRTIELNAIASADLDGQRWSVTTSDGYVCTAELTDRIRKETPDGRERVTWTEAQIGRGVFRALARTLGTPPAKERGKDFLVKVRSEDLYQAAEERREFCLAAIRATLAEVHHGYMLRKSLESPPEVPESVVIVTVPGTAVPLVLDKTPFLSRDDGLWHFGAFDRLGNPSDLPLMVSKRSAPTRDALWADRSEISIP